MKNYKKAKMVAKNAPMGSYSAGCPENTRISNCTSSCELGR